MSISKTSRTITKKDLDAAYKQGFADCAKTLETIKTNAFLNGIEASKTIEWGNESEEIERVLREWGYKTNCK